MTIATIFADIPTGWLIVLGLIVFALAIRFRGIVSLAVTAFFMLGTWNAGDPQPVLCIAIGFIFWIVLTALASYFGGSDADDAGAPAGGYSHAAEQARLASEYHRRDRESRF